MVLSRLCKDEYERNTLYTSLNGLISLVHIVHEIHVSLVVQQKNTSIAHLYETFITS